MQSKKKSGQNAIGVENEGRNAIAPFKFTSIVPMHYYE